MASDAIQRRARHRWPFLLELRLSYPVNSVRWHLHSIFIRVLSKVSYSTAFGAVSLDIHLFYRRSCGSLSYWIVIALEVSPDADQIPHLKDFHQLVQPHLEL